MENIIGSYAEFKDKQEGVVATNNEETFDIEVKVTGGGASGQTGAIRLGITRCLLKFDEANEDSLCYGELIAERDDEKITKRQIFEVKTQLYKYKAFFTDQEFSIVNLILSGYSFADLEHGEMMSRTTLYLTFKNAVKKLKKYIKQGQENSK